MSLDRDISQRLHDKYDPHMAVEAREWIEVCLGENLPDDDLMDSLKDGTVLCRLLNVVTPGSTKYKVSKMPFVQVCALLTKAVTQIRWRIFRSSSMERRYISPVFWRCNANLESRRAAI
jgi:Calponin homology (CH) domain